jgi:hypothetical protein
MVNTATALDRQHNQAMRIERHMANTFRNGAPRPAADIKRILWDNVGTALWMGLDRRQIGL